MADKQFDKVIFSGTSMSDMIGEIWQSSRTRAGSIQEMIIDLKNLIKTPNDAMLLIPLISEYLGRGISNDDVSVKLTSIIQRAVTRELSMNKGGNNQTIDTFFTLEEFDALQQLNTPEELPKLQIPILVQDDTKASK